MPRLGRCADVLAVGPRYDFVDKFMPQYSPTRFSKYSHLRSNSLPLGGPLCCYWNWLMILRPPETISSTPLFGRAAVLL